MIVGKLWLSLCLGGATVLATGVATASAQTPETVPPIAEAHAAADDPPGTMLERVDLSAQLEGGITLNPATPKQDFGQLFTDHPDQPMLNQLLLTANRSLDPKATGFDWGFKFQFMYGSDARYTHFLGELDKALPYSDRNQLDVVEANIVVHLPLLTEGGVDIKVGQYSSPLGFETIDPSTNPFYSHSYIFNFGLPMKHTGILTTSHISQLLDVYWGADTGVNTTIGPYGDDNSAIAVIAGFGLNMLDGDLKVLALSHIGPENASRSFPTGYNVDAYYRYLNDVIITYKATPKLTVTTELNLIRDDALGAGASQIPKPANAFGIAQYASYGLSETVTLNGRAEVYRDDNGLFVAAYPINNGYVNAEQGLPALVQAPLYPATYAEVTIGLTYKPSVPSPLAGLLIRPELRYDHTLDDTHPYNGGRDHGAFTAAADFVLTF